MTFPRIARFRTQLAVVIGVKDYAPGVGPLTNAAADAEELGALLRDRHGYAVKFIKSTEATHARLSTLFEHELSEWVATECKSPREHAQVLIYFAGHGVASERAGEGGDLEGFILPVDADRAGTNWLSMTTLRQQLDGLRCHHLLLILDCCFAGTFPMSRFRDVKRRDMLHTEQYDHYLRRAARQLLASCAYDEKSLDQLRRDDNGGPFARALIEGLGERRKADLNGDGVVTASELCSYLREALAPGQLAGFRQTPNLWPMAGHDVGEYLFRVKDHTLESAATTVDGSNPYRGLEHYEAGHKDYFKGRDDVVKELVKRAARPLTVLLGPSGCGKSSVLHAGLAPALADAGIKVLGPLRIGADPLGQLRALVEGAPPSGPICLIVDQLDELLAHRDCLRFQDLLAGLVTERAGPSGPDLELQLDAVRGRTTLVVALRSDTEPHFMIDDSLGKLVGDAAWSASSVYLKPMNREELRQCIEGPAGEKIVFFDPSLRHEKRLVDKILDEVDQVPGALPMLSVALQRTYETFAPRRVQDDGTIGVELPADRTITWQHYEQAGGVTGALQAAADALYNAPGRDDAYQDTFRRVLLRMVAMRGGEVVRRAVQKKELRWKDEGQLATIADQQEDLRVAAILGALASARLTVPANSRDEDPAIVPVHDALLTGWPELKRWIDAAGPKIAVHRELTDASARNDEQLWDDDRITRLDALARPAPAGAGRLARWYETNGSTRYPIDRAPPHTYTAAERRFIIASLRKRRTRRALTFWLVVGTFLVLAFFYWRSSRDRDRATRAATAERATAERERDARRALQRTLTRAQLARLGAYVESGRRAEARSELLAMPASKRSWEWAFLLGRCGFTPLGPDAESPGEARSRGGLVLKPGDAIECEDDPVQRTVERAPFAPLDTTCGGTGAPGASLSFSAGDIVTYRIPTEPYGSFLDPFLTTDHSVFVADLEGEVDLPWLGPLNSYGDAVSNRDTFPIPVVMPRPISFGRVAGERERLLAEFPAQAKAMHADRDDLDQGRFFTTWFRCGAGPCVVFWNRNRTFSVWRPDQPTPTTLGVAIADPGEDGNFADYAACRSPDGERLFAFPTGPDGQGRVFELSTGRVIATTAAPPLQPKSAGHESECAFTPSGQLITRTYYGKDDTGIEVWNARDATRIFDSSAIQDETQRAVGLTWSEDGALFAIAYRDRIWVLRPRVRVPFLVIPTARTSPTVGQVPSFALGYSPDRKRLLVGATLLDTADDAQLLELASGTTIDPSWTTVDVPLGGDVAERVSLRFWAAPQSEARTDADRLLQLELAAP